MGEINNEKVIKYPEKSEKLAELVGIILGDGNLHKKKNIITIVGSLYDKEYYEKRVIPLFDVLFNKKPYLKRRKDRNSYYLMICNKEIMKFLISIGLKRGPKTDIKIPEFILEKENYKTAFLRGLFDTDRCITFSKKSKKVSYYPRTRINGNYSPMMDEVKNIFNSLKFNYCLWKDKRTNVICYELCGKNMMNKWINLIKPINRIHTTKFLLWKKLGYIIPHQNLYERVKLLKELKNNLNKNAPVV